MLPKEFSTPSRHNHSEFTFQNDDSCNHNNYQNNSFNSNQGSAKKKSHHPLNVSSSRFQAKGTIPGPFFQDFGSGSYDSTDVTHSCVVSEPINAPYYIPVIEHLDLNSFKTKLCTSTAQHNHKHCPFYHNAKDHKRPGFFYSAELCEYAEKEGMTCPNGEMCLRAHNRVEQLYRPEKYKTKFCTFYPHSLEKCDYGTFCSFAHNENDITIELIHNYEYDDDFYIFHFKTVWCPFNLTQHDKALCVYAHNWQDYRRKPNVCAYEPNPCLNWKSTDFILNYEDGCPNRDKCVKCHGWKEQEYHPLNYKIKSCPAGKNCAKARDCPHFHNSKERRLVAANVINKVFRYVPRNRIITNTFKVRSEERMLNYSTSSNNSNFYSTAPSLNTYPSVVFSHDGDSFYDPNANVSDPFMNAPMQQNPLSEIPVRHFESLRNLENEDNYGMMTRPRKQSYDFETVHSKPNGNTLIGMPKMEGFTSPFDPNKYDKPAGKPRRWSTHDEASLNQDSDRLFREIVLSSDRADSIDSPLIKNFAGKENRGTPLEMMMGFREGLVMAEILESENN